MDVRVACKHGKIELAAADEDELVARVQEHVRTHDRPAELTRAHVLTRLRRQQGKSPQCPSAS